VPYYQVSSHFTWVITEKHPAVIKSPPAHSPPTIKALWIKPVSLTFAATNNRIQSDAPKGLLWRIIKNLKMPLTKEKKSTIFSDFGGKEANTGSTEGQIALLTERISQISNHLQDNKKDFSSHRGLMQLVGKRKRLLNYLQKHNLSGYRQLIEKLGIRK
jgi:small subunit ribosomal protein S15